MNSAGNESTAEFDDFMASGDVEVGSEIADKGTPEPKKATKQAEPDPIDDQSDEDTNEPVNDQSDDTDDQPDDDTDDQTKQRRKPSDRIKELSRRNRELQRQLNERGNTDLLARLENLEKGLQPVNTGGNQSSEKAAPDPTDTDKYPLGHLDDRYIEDKLDWLAEKKAAEKADAVLQRQQEIEQAQQQQQQQQELLVKVDTLADRGSELYDDFQENVVEAGMRGDWDLSQTTFEAAHEAEYGAQILYELAKNKAEASRVAKLSPFQQLRYVQERDADIAKGKSPRHTPKAGEPPRNLPRGANSRTSISPATDNLDDFEKAWQADAKRGHR